MFSFLLKAFVALKLCFNFTVKINHPNQQVTIHTDNHKPNSQDFYCLASTESFSDKDDSWFGNKVASSQRLLPTNLTSKKKLNRC